MAQWWQQLKWCGVPEATKALGLSPHNQSSPLAGTQQSGASSSVHPHCSGFIDLSRSVPTSFVNCYSRSHSRTLVSHTKIPRVKCHTQGEMAQCGLMCFAAQHQFRKYFGLLGFHHQTPLVLADRLLWLWNERSWLLVTWRLTWKYKHSEASSPLFPPESIVVIVWLWFVSASFAKTFFLIQKIKIL